MNRGLIGGFDNYTRGGKPNIGGFMAQAKGRLQADEARLMGQADDQLWGPVSVARYTGASAGAGRFCTINPQSRVSSVFFPGDIGSVFNVGSGNLYCQTFPYTAAYNAAGTWIIPQNLTSNVSQFESNTIVTNAAGASVTLPGIATGVSGNAWVANGGTCTTWTPITGWSTGQAFDTLNGGTLSTTAYHDFEAGNCSIFPGATVTTRSGFHMTDSTVTGTLTNQIGLEVPALAGGTTNIGVKSDEQIQLRPTTRTFTATPNFIEVGSGATMTLNFASAALNPVVDFTSTVLIQQNAQALGMSAVFKHGTTYRNVLGTTSTFGPAITLVDTSTINADTQTISTSSNMTTVFASPTYGVINAGTLTLTGAALAMSCGMTVNTGCTLTLRQGVLVTEYAGSGTVTTQVGIDINSMTKAGTNIGIRNASSLRQQGAVIATNNTVTVTTNAGTVATTAYLSTFTNSSAAAMTITMSTTGAVDGQKAIVRIYDFSAVAESITWVNTENSGVTVPGTSNGSTTLPLTVGFIFNNSTTKWRCVAVA